MAFTGFTPTIANLLQQNFLAREMEEGLDSTLAYRRLAIQETFPGRIGETLTRTRTGRITPLTTPMQPYTQSTTPGQSTQSILDNNLLPQVWSVEQYNFTMAEYAGTQDLNLMQEQAQIADQFIKNARNNGVWAAQSLERICRLKLFGAYLSGNTRVIALNATQVANGNATAATIANAASGFLNVDDVRGFLNTIPSTGGAPTTISGTNPLVITIGIYTFNVIDSAAYAPAGTGGGVPVYNTNFSPATLTTSPDAIPGQIHVTNISGATIGTYTSATGDPVVAANAPAIFRPTNRSTTSLLTSSDVLHMSLIEDATAYLRDNGVPPMDDGTYHCILDNTSMRQLFADSDFKILYAGRYQSNEFQQGEIIRLLGVTFVPTTEAYIQPSANANDTGYKVRRPIIVGAESLIQGNFEGMETWLSERGFDRDDSTVAMVDGVVQIVREPLDRLQQIVSMTWTWIGDYAVPTDITANSSIIPTASSALYKRAAVIEHAG